MDLRITVTYPATDGSMPESVEVLMDSIARTDEVLPLLPGIFESLMLAPAIRLDAARERGFERMMKP
jgi:hypothetical protein